MVPLSTSIREKSFFSWKDVGRMKKLYLPTSFRAVLIGSAGHRQGKKMQKNDLKLVYEQILIQLGSIPPRVDPLSTWLGRRRRN